MVYAICKILVHTINEKEEFVMYKFAIVEDNEAAAEKLAGFLERYANENNEVFEIIKFT